MTGLKDLAHLLWEQAGGPRPKKCWCSSLESGDWLEAEFLLSLVISGSFHKDFK